MPSDDAPSALDVVRRQFERHEAALRALAEAEADGGNVVSRVQEDHRVLPILFDAHKEAGGSWRRLFKEVSR